jgi:hypothetical protein
MGLKLFVRLTAGRGFRMGLKLSGPLTAIKFVMIMMMKRYSTRYCKGVLQVVSSSMS